MAKRSVILAVVAAALVLGLVVSGCKRDKRTAMKTTRETTGRGQAVRPAEVLSASVYRPRTPTSHPAPIAVATAQPQYIQPHYVQPPYGETAYASPQIVQPQYVQPQYAAVQVAPARYTQAQYFQLHEATYRQPESQYVNPQLAYAQAVYSSPAPLAPRPMQPTPDLTMAKAALVSSSPQAARQIVPVAQLRIPIPELEPVGFQRLPPDPMLIRPAATVMAAEAGHLDRQEVQRALAPLAQAGSVNDPRSGEWVASPATAMRGWY